MTESLIYKEGWIRKKSFYFFSKWPIRYFVLDDKCLYCYVTASKEKFLGGVNFDKISIRVHAIDKEKELVLLPLTSKGSVKLKFFRQAEYLSWKDALNQHVLASRGCKKALVDYPLWVLNRISPSEFMINADSGDLLLFKNKNLATCMQRLFSNSEYDHIGMIYKYPGGDISFLESTKEAGVSICYWDDFISNAWGLNYEKISYRKLETIDRKGLSERLEEFIQKVLGKKFSFNTVKLLSRFAPAKSDSQGFFCSELVAKAYQEIGLIDETTTASSYWPGDFSETSKISLKNADLSGEKILDFNIIQSVLTN